METIKYIIEIYAGICTVICTLSIIGYIFGLLKIKRVD